MPAESRQQRPAATAAAVKQDLLYVFTLEHLLQSARALAARAARVVTSGNLDTGLRELAREPRLRQRPAATASETYVIERKSSARCNQAHPTSNKH